MVVVSRIEEPTINRHGFLARSRTTNGMALPAPDFKMIAQHNGKARLALQIG